jgi:hypothetical protein
MLYPFAAAASVATDVRALMFIYLFFGNFANIESRRAMRQESRLCQMPTPRLRKNALNTKPNGKPFSCKQNKSKHLSRKCSLEIFYVCIKCFRERKGIKKLQSGKI